ncbi:sulfite exporter TauE/SafE family protein [Flavimaricola marinus]|uniref:Probable membrane transporter protein n=1 Tax=Flavimaricola marinus TaxID=1819565 RepID=A0A238LCQ6_9RHOB|nr:sulfite exporter TauE/SafE family protein [Flavimaricola marinus]SMY06700.1 Sulfite exporter TauE/SafE [Flavimaricola marinus]
MPFDLGPLATIWMAVAIFGAAYVRGYAGFGFAALIVSSASLVTSPLYFVPVVVLADVVLTAQQARGIWAEIAWRRVLTLLGGALIGVPLGVLLLTGLGIDMLRAVISLFVLAMCGLLYFGWHLSKPQGDKAHFGTGVISGLANGAAVGGLPVAVFFSAQTLPATTFRATVIAYFTMLDIWTLPNFWAAGLISRDTLIATVVSLPLMSLGVWLGGKRFRSSNPENFRRFAILLLATLAGVGLMKSVI